MGDASDNRFYREPDPERPPALPPTHILVSIPIGEARELSFGCADFLCWAAGFKAARQDATETHPPGTHSVRALRSYVDRALNKHSDPDSCAERDLPF